MKSLELQHLEELMAEDRFDEAAREMNEAYTEISGMALAVFEDLLDALAKPRFSGDMRNLAARLHVGSPSRRSNLRRFLADPEAKNCLTAVLVSLEKEVPSSVNMGFTGVSSYFRSSDFASTFRAGIINYEPEFSRLTDERLVRLLSSPPNTVDMSLFDDIIEEKKGEVLKAYLRESLNPVRESFHEKTVKFMEFLGALESQAAAFRKFFKEFRSRDFIAGNAFVAEWSALGNSYFQLELAKSSLMLPISPRALYWGMEGEYPGTLNLLRELKALVTPDITVGEPRRDGEDWTIVIECRNPGALREDGFLIEPLLRYRTGEISGEEFFSSTLAPLVPQRSYEYRVSRNHGRGRPLPLSLRITCEARYYPSPFTVERALLLGEES